MSSKYEFTWEEYRQKKVRKMETEKCVREKTKWLKRMGNNLEGEKQYKNHNAALILCLLLSQPFFFLTNVLSIVHLHLQFANTLLI